MAILGCLLGPWTSRAPFVFSHNALIRHETPFCIHLRFSSLPWSAAVRAQHIRHLPLGRAERAGCNLQVQCAFPKIATAKLLFPHPKILPPGPHIPPNRRCSYPPTHFFSLFFHLFPHLDFGFDFDHAFARFLTPKWTPKVLKIAKNLVAHRSLKLSSPLARFWLASGRSDPRSDCACAVETPLGHFWRRPGNSSKSTPKCLRKATRNRKKIAKKRHKISLQFSDAC